MADPPEQLYSNESRARLVARALRYTAAHDGQDFRRSAAGDRPRQRVSRCRLVRERDAEGARPRRGPSRQAEGDGALSRARAVSRLSGHFAQVHAWARWLGERGYVAFVVGSFGAGKEPADWKGEPKE